MNILNKVDSDENVPSETGTYTLRLDSAEVRDRKNLINITHESLNDQNSATESADQGTEQSQKSPTIVDEPEFEIPTAVSARITEWFNRNDAAESRKVIKQRFFFLLKSLKWHI